jgi:hypothetical protein
MPVNQWGDEPMAMLSFSPTVNALARGFLEPLGIHGVSAVTMATRRSRAAPRWR